MSTQNDFKIPVSIKELTPELCVFLNETRDTLTGSDRRLFMAKVVKLLGPGGKRNAERCLGWNRCTINKGIKELDSGIVCIDDFSSRGRKGFDFYFPNLRNDIHDIVNPESQTDPTFRTTNLYSPITVLEVRRRLISDKGYDGATLPKRQTITNILNELGYSLKKVQKVKPKKVEQTDAIFEYVHRVNRLAAESDGVIRLSIDTKANLNIGQFSRGGYNRCGVKALDHDFAPIKILKPFGIFLPEYNENYFYFTEGHVTADFIVDSIEDLWPILKKRFNPHTIVINADNGPENSSRRTQFIERIVSFAHKNQIDLCLAYYPPYHSKYNPIERVWAVLENHWRGEIIDTTDKALGLARTMTWKGIIPVVKFVRKAYQKGVSKTKKAMDALEKQICRVPGIEKWAVDIHHFG